MLNGVPPYKALLTHGFAVDGEGRKMSKSKGNVVVPQKVAGTLGAEILRLWVGATDYSGELSISDEILKRVVESYRRIRNTLRFLLANTADFDAARDAVPLAELLEIDRFALVKARAMADAVADDYARYEFHLVVQRLQTYCSEDLGGFYLDVLKDRLYTAAARQRRAALGADGAGADPRRAAEADGADPVVHRRGSVAILRPDDPTIFVHTWDGHAARASPTRDRAASRSGSAILAVRALVQKELEAVRQAGAIGSSLQAEVDIVRRRRRLRRARVARRRPALRADHVRGARDAAATRCTIAVAPSAHPKCERCWHWRADVGARSGAPGLCGRCVANLFGAGEAAHAFALTGHGGRG